MSQKTKFNVNVITEEMQEDPEIEEVLMQIEIDNYNRYLKYMETDEYKNRSNEPGIFADPCAAVVDKMEFSPELNENSLPAILSALGMPPCKSSINGNTVSNECSASGGANATTCSGLTAVESDESVYIEIPPEKKARAPPTGPQVFRLKGTNYNLTIRDS